MKLSKVFPNQWAGNLIALLSGAMLTLAFAPFSIYPLGIISPALLLAIWLPVSANNAFWRGLLFGLGLFGTGISWVYISIHTYGDASILLSSSITTGFVILLALFPALLGWFLNHYFPKNNATKRLCAFPALWVLFEWIRSWILTGFPWLFIGYSQIDSPLRGYAPIFSVYGVSLAALATSALLVNIFYSNKIYKNIIAILLIWVIGFGLTFISWTSSIGKPLKISLIQGNIPQNLKWSWDAVAPTLQRYQQLTEKNWDSQIIIWPEAAVPIALHDALDYLKPLHLAAKKHGTALITGIPIEEQSQHAYYNAVLALGNGFGFYLKKHLVPFGEYTPMPHYLTHFLNQFHIPLPNTIPNQRPALPLLASGANIAAFICYEVAFPELVLSKDSNINMLLTVSDDAWFGHSIALAQHVEMAQMRALEMGRPLLFVSNTGITAFISPQGKIEARAPIDKIYVLTSYVQRSIGKTPWQRLGMDPILLITIILIVIAVITQRRKVR